MIHKISQTKIIILILTIIISNIFMIFYISDISNIENPMKTLNQMKWFLIIADAIFLMIFFCLLYLEPSLFA